MNKTDLISQVPPLDFQDGFRLSDQVEGFTGTNGLLGLLAEFA